MPLGALSKGPRPIGTALTPGLLSGSTNQEQLQRQLQALNDLSRLRMSKAPALLLHLFHHGPQTVVDCARALGWSTSAASYAIRTLSTGRYRQNQVVPPHANLLWIEKLEGAPGTHLKVCLRPEAVQLCHDIIGIPSPASGNPQG